MRVVVVEDDRDIGLLVGLLADLEGHDVELLTPWGAMARTEWRDVDVLIVDWILGGNPPLTGGDVIDRSRNRGSVAKCVIFSAVAQHIDDAPIGAKVINKGHGVALLQEELRG